MRPDEIRKIADAARRGQIRTSQTEDPHSIILALERRLGDELPQQYVDAILFASNPEEMSQAANAALSFIEGGDKEDMWEGERSKFLSPEMRYYLDNPGLYDEMPTHERLRQDFESIPDLRGKVNAIMAGNHQLFGRQGIQPGGDRFEKEAVNWQDVKGFFGNLFNPKGTRQLQQTPAQSQLPMDANGNFDGRAYYGERYDSDPVGMVNSTDWSQYGAKAQNAQQAQQLGNQQYALQAAEYQKGMLPSQLASQKAGIYNTPQGDTSRGYTKAKDGTTVPTAEYLRGAAAGTMLLPKVKSINVQGFQQVNNPVNYAPPPANETQGYQKGWMDALASNSKTRKTAGAKERRLQEIIRDRKGTPKHDIPEEEDEPSVLDTLKKHRRLDPNSTRNFPAKILAQELQEPDAMGPELDEEIPEEMDDPKDLIARIDSLLDAMDGDPDQEIAQIALKLVQRLDQAIREPFDQQEADARQYDNETNEMQQTRTAAWGIDHHTTGVVDHLKHKSVEDLKALLQQADEKIALDPQPRYRVARDHIVQALEAHGIRIS